jgi:hypothetical protein
MCPANLPAYLDQQQKVTDFLRLGNGSSNVMPVNKTDSSKGEDKGPPLQLPEVPLWPPAAQQQGLTCTLEVSHLATALPGSKHICNVLRIKNNLLSVLHSWQMVWQMQSADALAAVGVDGAMLTDSRGSAGGCCSSRCTAQGAPPGALGTLTSFTAASA